MKKIKGIKAIVSCALVVGLCGSSFVQMVSAETFYGIAASVQSR